MEKAGVRPERLQLEWISAAEGQKFAKVMKRLEDLRRTVTVEEIDHARKALAAKPKKKGRAAAAAPEPEPVGAAAPAG
jgi:heterodisulfide reductase subunit A